MKQPSSGLYVRSANGIRTRDERSRRLTRKVRQTLPWLTDADAATARAWSQLEVLADAVYMQLRRDGVVNKEGEPKRLLDAFRLLRASQLSYSQALGMSPAARLAIKVSGENQALDIAALCARPDSDDTEDVEAAGTDVAAEGAGQNGRG